MMDMRGGGDEKSLITFPFTPTKIVGFIDNTNHDAYEIDYNSWTAELKKDIISPENLMDYCKNANGGEYASYIFDTIIEYDKNIDFARRYEDDYHTSPYIVGGICDMLINYNGDGNQDYNINHASFYSYFIKVTIDDKDYLLISPKGD